MDISCQGLRLPAADELLSWDDVANFEYEDGMGADVPNWHRHQTMRQSISA